MNPRTLLAVLALAPAALASDLPPHDASDPKAAVVTQETLVANDRFWPYRVTLERPLPRPGGIPLEAGETGVLIRVEDQQVARVDFGRDGLYEVPIDQTDLVANANQVRVGAIEKVAPHFVYAIGPRMVDPKTARVPDLGDLSAVPGYLAVFADPTSPDFAALAHALAPLQGRAGVMTIFFPQGSHADRDVAGQLIALGWPVPFVFDHLSEDYTRTLVDPGLSLPAVVLQTNEGRVIFQSRWSQDTPSKLAQKISAAFGATARAE